MAKAKPNRLIPMENLEQAAECFRTLAHPVRLRMIQMLLDRSYTVGELAEACGVLNHVASEHLRLMKHCGFLHPEKDGRKTYYKVIEPHLAEMLQCVQRRFGES